MNSKHRYGTITAMVTISNITQYIPELANTETFGDLFNPYRDVCPIHDKHDAPEIRRNNLFNLLKTHMGLSTISLLLFEAPSYAWARRSGAPFVNEDMFEIVENILKPPSHFVKATKTISQSALTTKIVWNILTQIDQRPLILETVPFHPHAPDNQMTNRKPTQSEITKYGLHVQRIVTMFKIEKVIAVGRTAEKGGCSNYDYRLRNDP